MAGGGEAREEELAALPSEATEKTFSLERKVAPPDASKGGDALAAGRARAVNPPRKQCKRSWLTFNCRKKTSSLPNAWVAESEQGKVD